MPRQSRIHLIFLLLSFSSVIVCQGEDLHWHVLHSLTPSYPQDPSDAFLAAHETSAHLSASWGERESILFFFASETECNRKLRVRLSSFRQDEELLDATSLRLQSYDVQSDSWRDYSESDELEGLQGNWLRLNFTAAFEAEAGVYSGYLHAECGSETSDIPLQIQLWEFDLPLDIPLERAQLGSAASLADVALGVAKSSSAKLSPQTHCDLPGQSGDPLATRILPLAAWRAGLRELIVKESDALFDYHYEDGLADLAYYLMLRDDPALLAERIAALSPARSLLEWDKNPAKLLHWRLAAGSYLGGEEDIALHLVREMEALKKRGDGQLRSLFDEEGAAWGWKGVSNLELLDEGGLSFRMDSDHPTARFKPSLRDWRRDGFLGFDLFLESESPCRIDLVLEQAGFRKSKWSYRLHLKAGELRSCNIPLPRTELDLGKVHQLELQLVDEDAECRLEVRTLGLR
jgi:hypothetical protein